MKMKNYLIDKHNELYDYINSFDLYNEFELLSCISDYFNDHNDNIFYSDLLEYSEIASQYLKDNKIEIDND
jgi:hypothetical protein